MSRRMILFNINKIYLTIGLVIGQGTNIPDPPARSDIFGQYPTRLAVPKNFKIPLPEPVRGSENHYPTHHYIGPSHLVLLDVKQNQMRLPNVYTDVENL